MGSCWCETLCGAWTLVSCCTFLAGCAVTLVILEWLLTAFPCLLESPAHRTFQEESPVCRTFLQHTGLSFFITGTRKFDRGLTQILHNDLHWLDVPQRVTFKLYTTVYKCLHGLASKYLANLCVLVAEVVGQRQLCSPSWGLLDLPCFNMSNYGRRAFSFAGPHTWNLLPDQLWTSVSLATFKRSLKTFLFGQIMYLVH